MRRSTAALAVVAALVAAPAAILSVPSAGASRVSQQKQGSITIQSWLYLVPSENVLSGTVWDCFKITGAIIDQGGGPTWSDQDTYDAPNTMKTGGIAAASAECSDKVPAGGFILVPPPEAGQFQFAQYTASAGSPGGLTTVYATHTIAGQNGDIFISFSGTYNFTDSVVPVKLANGQTVNVDSLTTGPMCTWLITGGTGTYTGLQGSGSCFANAQNTFPWVNHTEHGQVWWARQS